MAKKQPVLSDEERVERDEKDLARETARVAKLSDDEVLQRSGYGRFGPGIVGKPLAERARDIMRSTGGGIFGPAITDPEFAARDAARKKLPDDAVAAEQRIVDIARASERGTANETPSEDAWDHVTLSGAKMLAQQHQLSYTPRVTRKDLIESLKAANVLPPIPVREDETEDDE